MGRCVEHHGAHGCALDLPLLCWLTLVFSVLVRGLVVSAGGTTGIGWPGTCAVGASGVLF